LKTLLVAPYKRLAYPFPPIGLGYLASRIREHGHKVKIVDCVVDKVDFLGFCDEIKSYKPDVVGINSWSCSLTEVSEMLTGIKNIDRRIVTVVGGPHPSAIPSLEPFKDADFGFNGEAEKGFVSLLSNDPLDKVPGLIYRNGVNSPSFDELDSIPAWDLMEPTKYCVLGTPNHDFTASIITTRGCPSKCTFCSAHIISGYKVRTRNLDSIFEELDILKHYGIKHINIMDENFTFNHDFVFEFCKRADKTGLRFGLPQGLRIDTLDDKILNALEKSFNKDISLGIESGSKRMLKLIRKGITKDQVRDAVSMLKRHGFKPGGYFILGLPTETKKEMYETLSFALELKLYRASFSPFLLLPGTDIYNSLNSKIDFSNLITDMFGSYHELSIDELYKIRKDIVLRFNLQPRVILDYLSHWNSFIFAVKKMWKLCSI
jgi:anaerobic magnesium-protoporphyrin IX monomethyl ester cyclase